jgi:hypothetical protein
MSARQVNPSAPRQSSAPSRSVLRPPIQSPAPPTPAAASVGRPANAGGRGQRLIVERPAEPTLADQAAGRSGPRDYGKEQGRDFDGAYDWNRRRYWNPFGLYGYGSPYGVGYGYPNGYGYGYGNSTNDVTTWVQPRPAAEPAAPPAHPAASGARRTGRPRCDDSGSGACPS